MSELRMALNEYLAVRRALGFKLGATGAHLHRFVDFAEHEFALYVVTGMRISEALQLDRDDVDLAAGVVRSVTMGLSIFSPNIWRRPATDVPRCRRSGSLPIPCAIPQQ